jgi:hypothetical protein
MVRCTYISIGTKFSRETLYYQCSSIYGHLLSAVTCRYVRTEKKWCSLHNVLYNFILNVCFKKRVKLATWAPKSLSSTWTNFLWQSPWVSVIVFYLVNFNTFGSYNEFYNIYRTGGAKLLAVFIAFWLLSIYSSIEFDGVSLWEIWLFHSGAIYIKSGRIGVHFRDVGDGCGHWI